MATRKRMDFGIEAFKSYYFYSETIGNLKQLTYLYGKRSCGSDLPTALKDLLCFDRFGIATAQFKTFRDVLTKMTSVVSFEFQL